MRLISAANFFFLVKTIIKLQQLKLCYMNANGGQQFNDLSLMTLKKPEERIKTESLFLLYVIFFAKNSCIFMYLFFFCFFLNISVCQAEKLVASSYFKCQCCLWLYLVHLPCPTSSIRKERRTAELKISTIEKIFFHKAAAPAAVNNSHLVLIMDVSQYLLYTLSYSRSTAGKVCKEQSTAKTRLCWNISLLPRFQLNSKCSGTTVLGCK